MLKPNNTVALLAKLSGLSQPEILWTFQRLKALRLAGHTADDAKAIVKAEAVGRPWEQATPQTANPHARTGDEEKNEHQTQEAP